MRGEREVVRGKADEEDEWGVNESPTSLSGLEKEDMVSNA